MRLARGACPACGCVAVALGGRGIPAEGRSPSTVVAVAPSSSVLRFLKRSNTTGLLAFTFRLYWMVFPVAVLAFRPNPMR